MKKTIDLGTVDYNGTGRKVNQVTIEVEITDGRLSMTGAIWNARHTDWISGGQNQDTIAELFPNNARVQRLVAIWNRWHLNDMRAGTPKQEAYLREHPVTDRLDWYGSACIALASVDLLTDEGYKFGSGWLREELPAEIIAELEDLFEETIQ